MEKSVRYVLTFVLLLFVCNAAAQEGNVNMSQYRLGVGDKILIKVFGQSDLSMETRIPDVGKINYPFRVFQQSLDASRGAVQVQAEGVPPLRGSARANEGPYAVPHN